MVLAGVSTDCCVLSTALAAADAGVRVRVVADACAGVSEAGHERALAAMALKANDATVFPWTARDPAAAAARTLLTNLLQETRVDSAESRALVAAVRASGVADEMMDLISALEAGVRAQELQVEYQDERGRAKKKKLRGFEARVFQHEYDHINGILHIDRQSARDRKMIQPYLDVLVERHGPGGVLEPPPDVLFELKPPIPKTAAARAAAASPEAAAKAEAVAAPAAAAAPAAPTKGFGAAAGKGKKGGGKKKKKR